MKFLLFYPHYTCICPLNACLCSSNACQFHKQLLSYKCTRWIFVSFDALILADVCMSCTLSSFRLRTYESTLFFNHAYILQNCIIVTWQILVRPTPCFSRCWSDGTLYLVCMMHECVIIIDDANVLLILLTVELLLHLFHRVILTTIACVPCWIICSTVY